MGDTFFERYFQGYYKAERKRLLYRLTGREKQHRSRKTLLPRVGTALYLYSDRAGGAQRTFLWEVPEIRAAVFCALRQPGKQN